MLGDLFMRCLLLLIATIFSVACATRDVVAGPSTMPGYASVITDVSAPSSRCTKEVPIVSFRGLLASAEKWTDRCVQISGAVSGWRLYSDFETIGRNKLSFDVLRRGTDFIGLNPPGSSAPLKPTLARVTGVLDTCERLYADPAMRLVPGYCHNFSGPVLHVVSMEPLKDLEPSSAISDH